MAKNFNFTLNKVRFDENYKPSKSTRLTTNFANLARGENRQENLRNALKMINNRCNTLAEWDNPNQDRYSVELDIVSIDMDVEGNGETFPVIEVLVTALIDKTSGKRISGIVGNNFSSYVRDYDFSIVLSEQQKKPNGFSVPDKFGDLHAKIFKSFVNSEVYKQNFDKPPVICLSVSNSKVYSRTANHHPILGVEYEVNKPSLTEWYFGKMGMQARYFLPSGCVAPLAFYFSGDLLNDYSNLELISTISTMETFQRIYRPEIYNANTVAGRRFMPSLQHQDHSLTQIRYDREERSRLAVEQGKFAEKHFIKPHRAVLDAWSGRL